MIDGGRRTAPLLPGQYATPRLDGVSLLGSTNRHFSAPVVASSARSRPYGDGSYIVLPITMGIAWSSRIRPTKPSGLRWMLQTRSSVATLAAVICLSGL